MSAKPKGIVSNSMWNYIGAGSALLIVALTIPYYIGQMGIERQGVLAILAIVTGSFGLLNAGVTHATTRYVAEFVAECRPDKAEGVVGASFVLNLGIGVLGVVIAFLTADVLMSQVFKVNPELRLESVHAMRITGGVWCLSQVAGTFRSALIGLQDQRRVVATDMLVSAVTAGACSAVLLWRQTLGAFTMAQLFAGSIALLIWIYVYRLHFSVRARIADYRASMGKVINYSKWQIVNSVFGVAAGTADRVIIGVLMSMSALGHYSVAQRVQASSRVLFNGVNQALFPALSSLVSEQGSGRAENLLVNWTWRLMFVSGGLLAVVAVICPAVLELWVGPSVASSVATPLRWLLLVVILEIPSATCASYLYARSMNRLVALCNIATGIVSIGMVAGLGMVFGVNGIAAGGFVALFLTRMPFHLWLHRRHLRELCDFRMYFMACYGLFAAQVGSGVAIAFVFDQYWSVGDGFIDLFALGGLAALAFGLSYCIIVYFFLGGAEQLRVTRAARLRLLERIGFISGKVGG
jgi:O-antigen/teichoic acid export membrane protein